MEIFLRDGEGYIRERVGAPNTGEVYFVESEGGFDVQRAGYPSSHYTDGLERVILRKLMDADLEYSDDESVNRRILSYPQYKQTFIRTGIKRHPKNEEWFLRCFFPQQVCGGGPLSTAMAGGAWEILELLEPIKGGPAPDITATYRLNDAFFGETGEHRRAQNNEWYLANGKPAMSVGSLGTSGAYTILKILNGEGVRFDDNGNIVE